MQLDYINTGCCVYKLGDSLKEQTKNIPSGHGVYRIYANSLDGQILYIGTSGRINQDGSYSKQNLKGRLNNKQGRIKREEFFISKIKEDKTIKQIVIEWFIVDTKVLLPTFCEATLIQDYFSQHSCLPKWNAQY